jgi:hypothetical protein
MYLDGLRLESRSKSSLEEKYREKALIPPPTDSASAFCAKGDSLNIKRLARLSSGRCHMWRFHEAQDFANLCRGFAKHRPRAMALTNS